MFLPQRWARGFLDASGAAAPEALDLVKAMAPVVLSALGRQSGTAAARRLEPLIRRAYAAALPDAAASSDAGRAGGMALGLILLLVKKNRLNQIQRVIEAADRELDARRGILRGLLESAFPAEEELLEALKRGLMKKTGAAGLRLDTQLRPELLAGYRLRIGGQVIEASLRLHLRQLGAELAEIHIENGAAHGGF
ncbi:MAG: F0F1 ATP synthase subunit delta [Treponema sp.]|nr:F0F1 ATP synthase subunit delta [Treponema sp.]